MATLGIYLSFGTTLGKQIYIFHFQEGKSEIYHGLKMFGFFS